MSDLSQTPTNSVTPQSPSADDFQALKEKVIELERQLAELRGTIDPDSFNKRFSDAITDSHKELCRVLTWQYVSICRRLLIIEGRLDIPDSYISCVVPVDFRCHDLVVTVPEITVADFARRPMPFALMPDPTRRFTRASSSSVR
ncbi:BZ3500_MvSof-1268-A1-R1_Chr2-1g04490 [Microbotryum saponariae]|uniref:BZ3500_MvSof-1268-A1-R1_Chr2-1g04490 protein n=1 Tax=Microbotryum saponariae TaxID=289078 RepID=A0A2X0K7M1_9BASI|nr:BZ3500_MvSof-1268-A1-R1_Chr2-1g04490 [Microbotryum saponariae]SCZ91830.1 BZ3501_MvSof-1269-A2-R1_Chr2-1g04146 [Microbotryum saponariae]